ncbi:MAG: DUF2142 domain-containing protein [Methanobrevibacter sp.]|jgi:uncharacterized membrane protein|nr:DUF2142 domain-containing protein [Methanobrevibacter sp.]
MNNSAKYFFAKHQLSFLTKVFIVAFLILGLLFIILNPLFGGYDEDMHIYRTYQISEGIFVSKKLDDGTYGGEIPENIGEGVKQISDIDKVGDKLGDRTLGRLKIEYDWNILNSQPSSNIKERMFSNTASYSPLNYIPASTGFFIGKYFHNSIAYSVYFARLFSLLFFIIFISIGLEILKKTQFQPLFFVIASLPALVSTASQVSADMMTFALIFIFLSLIIKNIFLKIDLSKVEISLLLITTLLIPICKQGYAPLIILILFTSFVGIKNLTSNILKILSLFIGAELYNLWSKLNPGQLDGYRFFYIKKYMGSVMFESYKLQISYLTHNILKIPSIVVFTLYSYGDKYLDQIVGVPCSTVHASCFSVVLALFSIILAASLIKCKIHSKKDIIIILIFIFVALAVIILLFLALYLVWNPIGFPIVSGMWGRYFIPILLILIIPITILINTIFKIDGNVLNQGIQVPNHKMEILISTICILSVIFTLCNEYVAFYTAI